MKKKLLALLLAFGLCLSMAIPAFAASAEATEAADRLNALGLFNGVGTTADGKPDYDLDRAPTRAEAVTMLVRLLGKDAAAKAETYTIPFTDVADWAKPYVGYAYKNGLSNGTSPTTFGSEEPVSATQYLTFVLRALGYDSSSDFAWDKAFEKTDELKITNGEYTASSAFTRGDAVIVSSSALDAKLKDGSKTLYDVVKENLTASDAIDQILAAANAKMEAATSMEGKMTMDMDMTVTAEGVSQAVKVKSIMDMVMFNDPMKMKMLMTTDMGALGKVTMEMYAAKKDGKYTMYSKVDGAWSSQTVDVGDIESVDLQSSMGADLDLASAFVAAGKATVNGAETNKYTGVISGAAVSDAVAASGVTVSDAMAASGATDSLPVDITGAEIDIAALYKDLPDIPVSIYLNKDGYILRYEMDMTTVMNQMYKKIIAQMGEEGIAITATKVVVTIDFFNFNKATDFAIPAEAMQ